MPKFIDSTKREPWATFRNLAPGAAEIKIIGEIGCPKESPDFWTGEMVKQPGCAGTYEEFDAELTALGDITDLTLIVSSRGGDYFTGLAIHDRLLRHPANKTCIIDGICASAATYIPVACQTVKMPATAQFMIHRAEGGEYGNAEDMEEMAAMLKVIDQNIAELYATRIAKPVDEILDMMSVETWLNGKQCLEMGFATEIIQGAAKAPSSVDPVTNKRTIWNFAKPPAGIALFDTLKKSTANIHTPHANPPDDPMNKLLIALANTLGMQIANDATEEQAIAAFKAYKAAPQNVTIDFESDEVKNAFNKRIAEATAGDKQTIADLKNELGSLKALITNGAAAAAGGGAPVIGAPPADGNKAKVMNRADFNKLPHAERNAFMAAGGKLED
jgi:ATP-dependent protease ClpP protease subunit